MKPNRQSRLADPQRGLADRLQERIIDVIGGAVVAACVTGFFWSMATGSDLTRSEIAHLTRAIGKASREVSSLRAEATLLREVLAQRREELDANGQLPTHAPVEEYFQALSAPATDRGLRVLRHNPLSARTYPGLLEQRYVFEVAGSTQSIIRFLETIEQSDFWADVSYLVIDGNSRAGRRGAADPHAERFTRQATLTISLFSAPATESTGKPVSPVGKPRRAVVGKPT